MRPLFLFFSCFPLFCQAQIGSGLIEFENSYNKAEFHPADTATDEMAHAFVQMMQNMVGIVNNKKEPNVSYYFDAHGCRILSAKEKRDSNYLYYDYMAMRQLSRYFTKQGSLISDTLCKHESCWDDLRWEYHTTAFLTDRKKILGFDCHKVEVLAIEYDRNDVDTINYIAYVTSQLPIPFHVIPDLREVLMEGTPLEICTISRKEDMYFESMHRAVRFSKKLPKRIFDVPRAVQGKGKSVEAALIDALKKK